jgi:RNA polymerase sigma factor (sigma-70 family)
MADDESVVPPEPFRPPPETCWTVVLENIGLVQGFIQTHCPYYRDRADLVQEGLLGLLEAARRFEPSRQVQFSTYAYAWIRNRVFAWLRANSNGADSSSKIDHNDIVEDDEMQTSIPTLEPPEVDYIRNDLARDLREHLVKDLDEIERLVVVLHWLSTEVSTLDTIAKALGTTRERARQIEELAFAKLRQAMRRRRK